MESVIIALFWRFCGDGTDIFTQHAVRYIAAFALNLFVEK